MDDELFEATIQQTERMGPARIQVLRRPSYAQIESIPLGSDVVIDTPDQVMAGVWVPEIRGFLLEHLVTDDGTRGGIDGYIFYLPPVVEYGAPTGEDIAAWVLDTWRAQWEKELGAPLNETMENFLRAMTLGTVARAREGMAFLPF